MANRSRLMNSGVRKLTDGDDSKLNIMQFRGRIMTLAPERIVPEYKKLIDSGDLTDNVAAYEELVRLGYKSELSKARIDLQKLKTEREAKRLADKTEKESLSTEDTQVDDEVTTFEATRVTTPKGMTSADVTESKNPKNTAAKASRDSVR